MSQSIVDKIVARIYGAGRGGVYAPKDFTGMTSLPTVRQILSRLAKEGKIRRLLRGIYDYPAFSKMLDAHVSPNPDAIAQAIARNHGWTIVPTGETALNILGLSTQVPAQYQYFSDGPSKKYAWKGGVLVLKHRTNKETTKLSPKTALMVQALKALGESRIDDSVLAKLRQKFDIHERMLASKEARYATSWVYEIIKRSVAED
jgi:hypothetical protein